jgi:hypothetical protein
MAETMRLDKSLLLLGMHVQSETVDVNTIGAANLWVIARASMEVLDLDEIVVTGAPRTTGASPGRRPAERRFTRRHFA